ncbi:hypothetical protein [Thiobaca trueperi]|nr:hypothetical protein [Thiobaca trueperi]
MTNGHLDEPRTVHGVVALRFDFGPATMDWRVVDPFRSIRSKRA